MQRHGQRERLDRRAGRPGGGQGQVEAAGLVRVLALAADARCQRADVAAARVHRNDRSFRVVVVGQHLLDRLDEGLLQVEVQRRGHAQTALVELVGRERLVEAGAHVVTELRCQRRGLRCRCLDDVGRLESVRVGRLLGCDLAVVHHPVEDIELMLTCQRHAVHGVPHGRRRHQTREHRRATESK